MPKESSKDLAFEIGFFESILRRYKSYVEVIEILGGLYTKAGRIEEGLKMDRLMVRLRPENSTAHYNLACSLALLNKRGHALNALKKAVSLGYTDYKWMMNDADLISIREEPEFVHLLAKLQTAGEERLA